MWYDRAKYTVNFTGKNGHYPSQGGAHFNLEELNNNATGSIREGMKNTYHSGNDNTHYAKYLFTLFLLIGQRTTGC